MSARKLGHVLIGGHRFPVESVRLIKGMVEVEFSLHGPVGPLSGNITIFGEDGQGIMQGHEVRIPKIPAGDTWVWSHGLTFSKIESYDRVTDFQDDGTWGSR